MDGSRCATCGNPLAPGGGECPRCLLQIGLDWPESAMPERLGPYQIVARLGEGGMGEVYRARDTRLGRDVAIKVLPHHLAADPERIARFRREARVAASLNHRGIAAVYGFEDADDENFLVMELVEGSTLAERLELGPMAIDEALALMAQVADGLEAAHEGGVVHRDLKPANVKITPAGDAKILDFGLAKGLDDPGETGAGPASITGHYTSPGTVFGTVPYMSPEQARGRAIDKRTDIWAFGCVLYECLSGKRAFDGDTATDVVAKILERGPDWDRLPQRTPARVREVLARCLEKDPRDRVRDCGDVRIELARALAAREWTTSGAVRAGAAFLPWRRGLPWAIAGAALAVSLVSVLTSGGGAPGKTEAASSLPMHMVVTDPDVPRAGYQEAPTVAVSPDGRTIAYVGKGPEDTGVKLGLYVRRADDVHARRLALPCDQQTGAQQVTDPFFSPDGKSIGFSCGGLYTVPLAGGPAVSLVESAVPLKGATWSSTGIVLSLTAKSGLVLVKEGGGPLETLTIPDASKREVSHRWPSAHPDGRFVLFTIKKEGIRTFDQGEIAVLDLKTRTYRTLVSGGTFGRFVTRDRFAFARGSTLLTVGFDPATGQAAGQPAPIAEGIMTEPGSGAAQFAVARDAGTLVFVPGGANVARAELAWIDRHGNVAPIGAPPQHYHTTVISPDGVRLASLVFGATDGIVVYDLDHRSMTRLPSEGNSAPMAWSPDSRKILYGTDHDGLAIMLADADGSGVPHRLELDPASTQSTIVFAELDGALTLVYTAGGSLWAVPLSEDAPPRRLGGDFPLGISNLALSPDGRWLAYTSDSTGRSEIYVRPFPTGGGSWQVSRSGGVVPSWSANSGELFWLRSSGDERWVCSARIAGRDRQLTASAPSDVFEVPANAGVGGPHPDGRRFILVRGLPPVFKGDRVEAILGWAQYATERARD